MPSLVLLLTGPFVAGAILALVATLRSRRQGVIAHLPRALRVTTVIGVAVAALIAGLLTLQELAWVIGPAPLGTPEWLWERRHALPLIGGILGVIIVATAPSTGATATSPAADLRRRTPLSFTERGWFVPAAVTLPLILIVTVLAGLASEPDEAGRYRIYRVTTGETTIGTLIYGWYYSIPCLVLLAVLVAACLLGLRRIARPPLGSDGAHDTEIRRVRGSWLLAVTTGAFLLHAGAISIGLSGTAGLHGGFSADNAWVQIWTPFAVMEPALHAVGVVMAALGVFCWARVWWTAVLQRPAAPRVRDDLRDL